VSLGTRVECYLLNVRCPPEAPVFEPQLEVLEALGGGAWWRK
jgi:hypothetical protein